MKRILRDKELDDEYFGFYFYNYYPVMCVDEIKNHKNKAKANEVLVTMHGFLGKELRYSDYM